VGNSVQLAIRNLFNFNGQAKRTEFNITYVGLIAAAFVLFIPIAFLESATGVEEGTFLTLVAFLYSIIALVIVVAASLRRLRDLGLPPILVVLILVPCLGLIFLVFLMAMPSKTLA
jgi:uncharacterized membrane protein YhaH (DUF805 family)